MRSLKILTLILATGLTLIGYQNCSKDLGGTVIHRPKNLLPNASFEKGTTGFNLLNTASGSAQVIPEAAFSGAYGLRLFKMAVEPAASQLPVLNPNKMYMLSFSARLVSHATNGAAEPWPYMYIGTEFKDASGTVVPETKNWVRVRSTTWEKYEAIIDPNVRSGFDWQFNLQFTSSTDTDNVVDIDDVVLEEIIIQ